MTYVIQLVPPLSSLDKKVVMAVSGLLLFVFIVGHLLGNLTIFLGPDALNGYADKLAHLGPLLWIVRVLLLVVLVAHIYTAVWVTLENRRARPVPYQCQDTASTTYAGRTMMFSGVMVTVFIIYHLLQYTLHVTHPHLSQLTDAAGRHDVYSMVVLSFQDRPIVLAYIIALLLLCAHLSHGLASLCQTLGLGDDRLRPKLECAGQVIAWLVGIGYIAIPVCVQLGIIGIGGRG